jgi:hypothetical protein
MNATKNTAQVVAQVFETSDYSMFRVIHGNRDTIPLHVHRLTKSMKEQHLVSPIIVNEKMEVIDGQNRLEASKAAGVPVRYIVVPGYGLEEVQRLNATSLNWSKMDYLKSYAKQGVQAYVTMLDFMQRHKVFSISPAEALLTQNQGGANNTNEIRESGERKGRNKNFEAGRLKIADLEKANRMANELKELAPHFDHFNTFTFVRAYLTVSKKEAFNPEQFIERCKSYPQMLQPRINVAGYIEMIEDVYNFRSRNKVSLKY